MYAFFFLYIFSFLKLLYAHVGFYSSLKRGPSAYILVLFHPCLLKLLCGLIRVSPL